MEKKKKEKLPIDSLRMALYLFGLSTGIIILLFVFEFILNARFI